MAYTKHYEESALISARQSEVFAHLDDPSRLNLHMGRSSWQMGGGKMTIALDGGGWQRVGSTMHMAGTAFGIRLSLDTRLTEYAPPQRKAWETMAVPRLLVIGAYRMGLDIAPAGERSLLRIFIDYDLPAQRSHRWFGQLLGPVYAKWCVHSMLLDAQRHFPDTARPR